MKPVVYKIEFPDGKSYIGSTINFSARRRTHLRHGARGEAVNSKLAAQFKKFPICGIYQVATGKDRETLHLLEQEIMLVEAPELNIHYGPNQLPEYYNGTSQAYGPFKSVKGASDYLGYSYSYVKRAAKKMSFSALETHKREQAEKKLKKPAPVANLYPLDPRKNSHLINDGGWCTKIDTRAKYGITKKAYDSRLERGWDKHRACTTPLIYSTQTSAQEVMPYHQREKANGISFGKYNNRLRIGWTPAEALELEPRTITKKVANVKKRYISVNGKTQTLDLWCAELNLPKGRVSSRLSLGWTEAQALEFAAPPGAKKKAASTQLRVGKKELRRSGQPQYTYQGVTGTFNELCKRFAPNAYRTAYTRKTLGMPVEKWFLPRRERKTQVLSKT